MEGGERLGDDNSRGNSDMDIVDATLQNQHLDKDQNVDAESLPHNSPTQLQQQDKDQVMVDQSDDTKNVDSTSSHMPEIKVVSENQHELEDAKTISHQDLITPKPKEKNVREMKNVLNNTEVFPVLYMGFVLQSFHRF